MLRASRRPNHIIILLLSLLLIWPLSGSASAATTAAPTVDYTIAVSLDQSISTLTGKETVTWTNPGTEATDELYLHLYPNAFRAGSTFLQESGGSLRGDRMAQDGYGEMNLLTLQSGGRDLAWSYVQPDDGNAADRTLARVELPVPVAPGQSLRVTMTFTVKLPQVFARMGKSGQFVLAGQWFPKVAAYEPAGVRGRTADGWDTHQYHGNTEFYADFGNYHVTIQVPQGHTVAATGRQIGDPQVVDGQLQYVFAAEQVHDFVWATDNDFILRTFTISSAAQPAVQLRVYLQPEHEQLADQYYLAAKETIDRLSSWLGPYPYTVLSLVCPSIGASGAGGMEYPTLVTGWDGSVTDIETVRLVLVHEIIHQYFYGLVASNEFEEAWLDEGFVSYLEDKIMEQAFGTVVQPASQAQAIYSPEPLVYDGWKYSSAYSYQTNVYVRGKLILHEIERRIGWTKMQAVLGEYVAEFSYRHPSTADFLQVLEQVSGRDFDRFFQDYVYGAAMQDLAIASATSKSTDGGFATTVTITQSMPEQQSVRLLARFADDTTEELTVNLPGQAQTDFRWQHPLALVSLELDPEPNQVILDNDRLNNLYALRANNRWTLLLSYFLHLLSQWIGW